MKLLSLFSGIGAFEKALDYLNVPYELVNYCEIDKYASKSYSLIHNVPETKNLGDITKINEKLLPLDIDILTHGSPCQDFSAVGIQRGGDIGSGTRSSLMWDTVRIVTYCKPKVIIWENVKNLLSKKHRHNFDAYIQTMDELGYNSYYKVLNAKDYGVPQNRKRVYTISIRKDIDTGAFKFPKPFELELRLRDVLEDEVDEKYYLSDKMVQYIIKNNEKWTGNNDKSLINKKVASTINTGEGSRRCDASNYVCEDLPDDYDLKQDTDINYSKKSIEKIIGNINTSDVAKTLVAPTQSTYPISQTLTDPCHNSQRLWTGYRIRKLTPKECFRLMGYEDDVIDVLVKNNISNSQLYKMAGNSIVVDVLEEIFVELFKVVKL